MLYSSDWYYIPKETGTMAIYLLLFQWYIDRAIHVLYPCMCISVYSIINILSVMIAVHSSSYKSLLPKSSISV